MNSQTLTFSGNRIAYHCNVDLASFSSAARICTTADGGAVESFDFTGPVLDLAYLQ